MMKPSGYFWLAVSVLVVLKTSLIGWWPFLALVNMPHDASLFVRQATKILEGEWLGTYSEFTLMKGPVTPLWMALMNFLGIPYLFSLHLLYVSACTLCIFAFGRFTTHRGYLLAVFALVLFSPYSFAYGPVASGFREGLHQPVLLAVIALSVILFMDFVQFRRVKPELSILFGVFFFMFWNNREEGVWILPYLCILVAAMGVNLWLQRQRVDIRAAAVNAVLVVVIPFGIWLAGTLGLAWKNYLEYEVFAVVEMKTPEFGRAYGNLIAIQPEKWIPTQTLQPDVLDKLYSLPSGDELDLNGRKSGDRHSLYNVNAVWLFRNAVRRAGYYDKGGAAVLSFYDRLGKEIESACEASRFDCGAPILNAFPPWQRGQTVLFLETFRKALAQGLVNDYDLKISDFFTIASPRNVLSIARLTNAAVRVEEASEPFLPPFYLRTIKVKTNYRDKIRTAFQILIPLLSGLALLGILSRVLNILRTRRVSSLDIVLGGLSISIMLLLAMFTMLMMNGITASSRLYFLFYPVLFPLVFAGILSLARDLSRYRLRFRTNETNP